MEVRKGSLVKMIKQTHKSSETIVPKGEQNFID